jgi:hypothetical protein
MAAIDKYYVNSYKQYSELRDYLNKFGTVTDDFGNTFTPGHYIANFSEDYFNNWFNKRVTEIKNNFDKYGKKWVEDGYLTEEEYDNYNPADHVDIPVMNTPIYFDVWMIRNCQDNEYLQTELKQKYGGGWSKAAFTNHNDSDLYYQILNKTSVYDTYKRNGLGKNIKVNLNPLKGFKPYGLKNIKVHISVDFPIEDGYVAYHPDEDMWYHNLELHKCNGDWTSSSAWINKYLSRKAIFRKLKKWNLPSGTEVRVSYIAYLRKKRYIFDYNLIVK